MSFIEYFMGLEYPQIPFSIPDESNTDNSNAEQIKRLYLECSERDKRIIKNVLDTMLDN